MALTEDDVQQILDLIKKSEFDYLEFKSGDLELVVRKGSYRERASDQKPASISDSGEHERQRAAPVEVVRREAEVSERPKLAEISLEGFVPIKAPMVGTFYVSPEPGAPPFIQEGSRVEEETQVGLIEIMKVFSSVQAGVRGTVSKVLVARDELVEYEQVLFLVKPDQALTEKTAQR
jgi:acetyl-CoA carboxylase biotin carboxyl carrier protein